MLLVLKLALLVLKSPRSASTSAGKETRACRYVVANALRRWNVMVAASSPVNPCKAAGAC